MLHIHACCKRMFQVFHIYVARVSSVCCICFAMGVFPGVSDVRRKCFSYFRTYVASVTSVCCKSRSGVAHISMRSNCRSRLLRLLGIAVVTMWAHETGRCIHGAHPQAWQVTDTHVGAGRPKVERTWAGP
jgi:hypothetical protein